MSVLDTLEICFQANLNGVDSQLRGISDQLTGLSGTVRGAEGDMRRAGRTMMSALSAGIRAGGAQAAAAASSVARSLRFDGGASAAQSAGRNLAIGFASGIRSGSGAVGAAASALAQTALRRMRSTLAIHSPSKVTAGFGHYFGEGFANGIGGTMDQVSRAANNLSGAALSSLRPATLSIPGASGIQTQVASAVHDALGSVTLTVPLYVDSMKLGEASIRGINAVTKSAGRILLTL